MCGAATRCHKVTLGNDIMPQWVLFHLIKYTAHSISIVSSRDQTLSSQRGVNAPPRFLFDHIAMVASSSPVSVAVCEPKSSMRLQGASWVVSEISLLSYIHRLWKRHPTIRENWEVIIWWPVGSLPRASSQACGAGFGWAPMELGADAHWA